jgi:hypothetical protein
VGLVLLAFGKIQRDERQSVFRFKIVYRTLL